MLDSVMNFDAPTWVKLLVAVAVVVVLVGILALLFRRSGKSVAEGGAQAPRGRQPRLAVIDAAEVDANPRARSAKLRAAERTEAAARDAMPGLLPALPALEDVMGG